MRRGNKISSEKRLQILEQLSATGYSVAQLARSHGISRSVLYKWARDYKAINGVPKQSAVLENNFVKLAVSRPADGPSVVPRATPVDGSKLSLEKASLIFNNLSISLEGAISSGTLILILKLLEEQNA